MHQHTIPVYLIAAVLLPAMVACTPNQAPTNASTYAEQMLQSRRGSTMAPPTPIHLPVQPQDGVAREIDKMPGFKWTVVLQEGTRAYVGTFPEFTGAPAPGATASTPHRGADSYAPPPELKQQSPEHWIRALNDWAPRVRTYTGEWSDRSGRMDPKLQRRVRETVRQALPMVQNVFITTDVASSTLLRGYSDYIHAGGDMSRYMERFHQRIHLIWPHGQSVAPDRPSASPDFGIFGAPSGGHTPVPGPVSR